MRRINLTTLFFLVLFCVIGCDNRHLRGKIEESTDGFTYLVILDNNGGVCGPIFVNGKNWKHEIGQKGKIEAGEVQIECGGKLSIYVEEGTVFYFDYWGP